MISNIEISFLRLPLNPRIDAVFVGLDNYIRILGDAAFWHSLWMTFWYTALVVLGSTGLGLAVAIFFNREFRMRKTARSLVILSYVTPSISLVFASEIHVQQRLRDCELPRALICCISTIRRRCGSIIPAAVLSSVVLFAIWRYFPYAFISFLAILQTIDKSLYEAAEMDGANASAAFSYRDVARHHAGAGHGGHAANHLDVLHVCGCVSAHHQGRHSGRISLQNRLCVQ